MIKGFFRRLIGKPSHTRHWIQASVWFVPLDCMDELEHKLFECTKGLPKLPLIPGFHVNRFY